MNAESDSFNSWCYKNDVISNLSKRVGIKKYEFCEGKYEKRTEVIARMGGIHFLNEILKSDNMNKKLKDVYKKIREEGTPYSSLISLNGFAKELNINYYDMMNSKDTTDIKNFRYLDIFDGVKTRKELVERLIKLKEKRKESKKNGPFGSGNLIILIIFILPIWIFIISIEFKKYKVLNYFYEKTKK